MRKKMRREEAAEKAKELLAKMTLTEKVGQVNQKLYGFWSYEKKGEEFVLSEEFCKEAEKYSGLGILYGLYRADPWSGRSYENGLWGEDAIRVYNKMQRYVIEHSRLGIPMLLSTECPHGHQALGGYLLPVNLGTGASFDPALYERACRVCARQLDGMGVDLALVSMLDILRDPRWGRSEECYSEDPCLSSRMAAAGVRGFQEEGVTVVAKHFAAQGETTGGINASAARIGERELREIHLPAAKACCEEKVGGVMAAYNEIDGVYCHGNSYLLKDILRGEMGFDGIVMADGIAIDQLQAVAGDKLHAGALALNSGVDAGLWDEGFGMLEEAVKKGLTSEEELDRAVLAVLTEKYARGLFENPYLEEKSEEYTISRYPESLELARESVVLLENKSPAGTEEKILPLKNVKKLALIGPHGDGIYDMLGDYSPALRENEGCTLLKGIKECFDGEVIYARGSGVLTGSEEELCRAKEAAGAADVIILTIGGSSSRFGKVSFDANGAAKSGSEVSMDCGEGVDCSLLEISPAQRRLADAVYASGKPVVTVVISGRPMVLTEDAQKSTALLQSFYPGPEGGRAIAEILFGMVNPSGVLPASLPMSVGQLPVYYNPKASYGAWRYYDGNHAPLYPFGYGGSYTKFDAADIEAVILMSDSGALNAADPKAKAAEVSFSLRNTGEQDGDAVALLYIKASGNSVVRRVKELKDFTRVTLESGQEKKVKLSLKAEDLYVWDSRMQYCAEAGRIRLILEIMGKKIMEKEFLIS